MRFDLKEPTAHSRPCQARWHTANYLHRFVQRLRTGELWYRTNGRKWSYKGIKGFPGFPFVTENDTTLFLPPPLPWLHSSHQPVSWSLWSDHVPILPKKGARSEGSAAGIQPKYDIWVITSRCWSECGSFKGVAKIQKDSSTFLWMKTQLLFDITHPCSHLSLLAFTRSM